MAQTFRLRSFPLIDARFGASILHPDRAFGYAAGVVYYGAVVRMVNICRKPLRFLRLFDTASCLLPGVV